MVDVNKVVDKVGLWHVPVLLLFILRSWPLCFHTLLLSFAAPSQQDHWCARPENSTEIFSVEEWKELAIPPVNGKYSRCLMRKFVENGGKLQFLNETQKCSSWEYDTTYYDWTLVREFGMVCDKSWYVSASQAAFMAGLMVGNMVFAKIADRYGRRKALLWSSLLMLVSSVATVFCRDYWSFNVTRFGTSIACGGYQCTIISILMESLSARKRMWAMLSSFGWISGNLILPWTAYFLPNWILQQIVFSTSVIPCLILWYFLPESPRWLLASGRVDEAEAVLTSVVRMNKVEDVELKTMFAEYRQQNGLESRAKEDPANISHPTYADIFRGPKMRVRTICILIMYFANRLLMFHLTFFSARMGGNPFWGFTLVSILGIPADIISVFFIRFLRRRLAMFVSFLGTAVFIVALAPFGEDEFMARVMLCTLAKILNETGTDVLSVFASESFPTVVRAMGIGSAYTVSRVGAMFSPFFKELSEFAGQGAAAGVSVAIALLGAVSALGLPETLNKSLPDFLADVDPDVYAPVRLVPKNLDRTRESRTT